MNITKKRGRQLLGAVALAGAAAIALAGCTTSPSANESGSASNKTITVAQVNEVTSFNYNTPQGNLDMNGMINYMTQPQFVTLGSDYKITPNTDLGTVEKLSDDPLTVKYTLNKDAKWSDGKSITSDDLLLGWAQASGYYDSATQDESTGKVTSGTQYFSLASASPFKTDYPTDITKDSITIKYKEPYVDWQLVNPIQFPAHVVTEEAGTTVDDLLTALKDTPAGDPAKPAAANSVLKKVADFVNTGYDKTSLPSDKKLLVSGGPLMVSAWTPKQSMTLVPNPEYTGEHKVKFGKLVVRFIGDANAQVTALQNGEVDAIQPQASADTVKALDAASGVKTIEGSQVAYDHLDLNFGSSVFKDENVRKAFLLTIPREQILNSIVTPINKDAKVLDSQLYLPGQDGYDDTVKNNDSSDYSKVDIAEAKKLLNGATPSIKILYNTENPNRVDTFQAIQASAAKAGIKVVDGGSPDWSSLLAGGDYDASIFGWVNPGAGNAAIPQLFQTNNSGNYNKFNDATASKLAVETQSTLDESKLNDMKMEIDKIAFDKAYGLPLFQSPGLFATGSNIKGIEYFGGQTGIFWNVWDWTK
ncbi:peptide/nickel transport system substrate-binding protein [Curtobacterium luteum]|uniref:Peptide ABC transporter substrate-binding protein n=1 Tax=Curtobacterium luteum TaxID=33881 RepID=A0A8H9GAN5_9MICO|nr:MULTISPECIES: ABC transporter family substrate-binding protein [Curtobacterium]MBM7800763.1 peptide/nickel transport system substrate-binding protein [Curtobacterium luteum]NUU51059.1 ABC transporter family substrate-binding protein [Curtobacterium luteum]GGK98256.1 peptide ABC transporter substrate-binding protein [Curtobacterium luteum]